VGDFVVLVGLAISKAGTAALAAGIDVARRVASLLEPVAGPSAKPKLDSKTRLSA
jgi:hypothetical protein